MVINAAAHGPAVTVANDRRVTHTGRLLRSTKLDELPQLINVLKGDMALVGPRPEDPRYVDLEDADHRRILSVRPGITGPTALAFSNEESLLTGNDPEATYRTEVLPTKLAMDLHYLEYRSFLQDLIILLKTLGTVLPRQLVLVRRLSNLIRRRVPWVVIDVPVSVAAFGTAILFHAVDVSARDVMIALRTYAWVLVVVASVYPVMNYLWALHRRTWRFATAAEVIPVLASCATSTVALAIADVMIGTRLGPAVPLTVVVLGGFLTFFGFVLARYRWRIVRGLIGWMPLNHPLTQSPQRVLIYGAEDSGQLLAWHLKTQRNGWRYEIVGFLDDDHQKRNMRIHGYKILGDRSQLETIIDRERVDLIVLAMKATGGQVRSILSAVQRTPVQVKVAPNMLEWMSEKATSPLREVTAEDLLGRPPASLDHASSQAVLGRKAVFVTGACGSIGAELCRQIAAYNPRTLIAFDNNETGLYDLDVALKTRFPNLDLCVVVGDVTNSAKLASVFHQYQPEVIFHVAAYKHVPLMERFPEEAVRVNVGGTRGVLREARKHHAERFVLVSTDKAVNPSSIMGATKRLAELLVTGDEPGQTISSNGSPKTLCTAVRFGNVLGTRGSVVPTFEKQIELGGPVTVTHPEMTRYFMELGEAASLIIQAASLTIGGDIFMLEMGERIRIDDLARRMIRMRGLRPGTDIPIEYVGIRPGEKLHEELTASEEETSLTDRPLIYRVNGNGSHSSRHSIYGEIDGLLDEATNGRRDRLIARLLALAGNGNGKANGNGVNGQLRDAAYSGVRISSTVDS